jgi:hypothetical protein
MEIASRNAEYPASIHHSHDCATSSHDEPLDADFETRIGGKPCGSETSRTRSSSCMEYSLTWEERRGISAHEAFSGHAKALAVDRNSPTRRKCMPRDMAICINFQGTSIEWNHFALAMPITLHLSTDWGIIRKEDLLSARLDEWNRHVTSLLPSLEGVLRWSSIIAPVPDAVIRDGSEDIRSCLDEAQAPKGPFGTLRIPVFVPVSEY